MKIKLYCSRILVESTYFYRGVMKNFWNVRKLRLHALAWQGVHSWWCLEITVPTHLSTEINFSLDMNLRIYRRLHMLQLSLYLSFLIHIVTLS
jgi:hypothetical protein